MDAEGGGGVKLSTPELLLSYLHCTAHYSQAITRPLDRVSHTGLLVHQVKLDLNETMGGSVLYIRHPLVKYN